MIDGTSRHAPAGRSVGQKAPPTGQGRSVQGRDQIRQEAEQNASVDVVGYDGERLTPEQAKAVEYKAAFHLKEDADKEARGQLPAGTASTNFLNRTQQYGGDVRGFSSSLTQSGLYPLPQASEQLLSEYEQSRDFRAEDQKIAQKSQYQKASHRGFRLTDAHSWKAGLTLPHSPGYLPVEAGQATQF